MSLSKRKFWILFGLIIVLGSFLRVYNLTLKPMHGDEGVLMNFFINPLIEGKVPSFLGIEYHGLAFNYLSFPIVALLGNSLFSLRLSSAIFGILTIIALYFLKDKLGDYGTLISALILAVSPIFVYYNRQYTGYPVYNFFILVFIILLFEIKQEKIRIYSLFILSAILININESFLIFLFILGLFSYFDNFKENKKITLKKEYLIGVGIFILLSLIIHTGFFLKLSNLNGIFKIGSDLTIKSDSTGHNKSVFYYLDLLIRFEIPLIILSFIGLIFYKKDKFNLFIIFFCILSAIIFSLISYKTNWTMISIFFPFILLTGTGFQNLIERLNSKKLKVLLSTIILFLIGVNLYVSINQNFVYVNDFQKNKIGYVETSIEVYNLTQDLKTYSKDKTIKVLVGLDSSWPLPSLIKEEYKVYYKKRNSSSINSSSINSYPDYDVFIIKKEDNNFSLSHDFEIKDYLLRKNYIIQAYYKK